MELTTVEATRSTVRRRVGALALAGLSAMGLMACDEDTVNRLLSGVNSLGPCFVQAYNAGPLSEPIDPSDSCLTMTPLAEPFNP